MKPYSPQYPVSIEPIPPVFRLAIGVCVNENPREFQQCHTQTGHALLDRLKQTLAEKGLSETIYPYASGCILGCEPDGCSVICLRQTDENGFSGQLFNSATLADIDKLIETALNP